MGLISRVSSRTYRKPKKIPKTFSNMVLSITNKLQKKNNQRASDIENNVAQTLLEIQNGADAATKEQLMQLHVVAVKEIDVGGRNALILMVPAQQVVGWQKVQTKIVRELEKKFSGKHVLVIGARKVMAKEARKAGAKCYKQKRPSAEVLNTFMKLFWKTVFSQLKSLVKGSDTKWTTLPSSKPFWTDPVRPTSSTKPPPFPPSTNDSPERTLFLNFQNTNSKIIK